LLLCSIRTFTIFDLNRLKGAMANKDIRWLQRFSNLKKAFLRLKEAVDTENLSELEREGLIQRFEYTYELAWKTLQDLLEAKGYLDIKGPTPVFQQAFQDGYITDGEAWMRKTLLIPTIKKSLKRSSTASFPLTWACLKI
jgi:hypothetical protein